MRHALVLVLVLLAAAAFPSGAQAHQWPMACSASGFELSIARNLQVLRPGQTLTYEVQASNSRGAACDVTAAKLTFTPPTGPAQILGEDLTLLGGSGPFVAGRPQWTAPATQAAGAAIATATLEGTLHDNPQDTKIPGISKTLATVVVDPRMTVRLTPVPATGVAPLRVTFHLAVTNRSDPPAELTDLAIDHPDCDAPTPAGGDTGGDGVFDAGEEWEFTCSRTFDAGEYSAGAVVTAISPLDGNLVSATAPLATVKVSAPVSTADLTQTKTAPPDVTAAQTPEPILQPTIDDVPSARVSFSYTGRFTPARACRGTVTLALKAGTQRLATKRVKLDRGCRYKVAFTIARSRLGGATTVTVTAKAGRRTASRRLTVPKT